MPTKKPSDECADCGAPLASHPKVCPGLRTGTVPGKLIVDATGKSKVVRAASSKPVCPQCHRVHNNELGRFVTCLWYAHCEQAGYNPRETNPEIVAHIFQDVSLAIRAGNISVVAAITGPVTGAAPAPTTAPPTPTTPSIRPPILKVPPAGTVGGPPAEVTEPEPTADDLEKIAAEMDSSYLEEDDSDLAAILTRMSTVVTR